MLSSLAWSGLFPFCNKAEGKGTLVVATVPWQDALKDVFKDILRREWMVSIWTSYPWSSNTFSPFWEKVELFELHSGEVHAFHCYNGQFLRKRMLPYVGCLWHQITSWATNISLKLNFKKLILQLSIPSVPRNLAGMGVNKGTRYIHYTIQLLWEEQAWISE